MNQVTAVLADIVVSDRGTAPCEPSTAVIGEQVGVGFFLELGIGASACGEANTNGGYLSAFLRASAASPKRFFWFEHVSRLEKRQT